MERLAKRVEAVHGIVVEAGVAVFPGDALAVEDLIAAADEARVRVAAPGGPVAEGVAAPRDAQG